MKPTDLDLAYRAKLEKEAQAKRDHELESVAAALTYGILFVVALAAFVWSMTQ